MFGVIFSILIAIALQYFPLPLSEGPAFLLIGSIVLTGAFAFLAIEAVSFLLCLKTLQKASKQTTSFLLNLVQKDRSFFFFHLYLTLFVMISVGFSIDLLLFHSLDVQVLLSVWVILFGLACDALFGMIHRCFKFCNPFKIVNEFLKSALKDVQNEHELNLCHSIDALFEISVHGIKQTMPSLTIEAANAMQETAKHFLDASKSISHHAQNKESKRLGIQDKVSFTLFYILKRLQIIGDQILESRLDIAFPDLLNVFGKVIISSAKLDMSIAAYPIHYLGKCAAKGVQYGLSDIGSRATFVFLEISKQMIEEIDLTYEEIKEPFLSIIHYMDLLEKEVFRQDKKISPKILKKPFEDLKTAFASPKIAAHQDTPAILGKIDSVLQEFQALSDVLRAMPPIPEIPKDLIARGE